MSYLVIVDMDQPGNRMFVGLDAGNDFELAEFKTIQEVKELKSKHHLGVFEWLAIGVRDDTDFEVL